MLFSSITFLYAFLPITLVLYFAVPNRFKNHVLLLASLVFYFFGEPVYTVLLLLSSLSDYLHSLFIEKYRDTPKAKRLLISSICVNLALLGFFKYADFLIGTVNDLFGMRLPLFGVPLPIGISFFTFQTMSYTIDVYRGDVRAEKNLATMATFVSLFPQLIAGPIVRYTDIAKELHERRLTTEMVAGGIRRFVIGLSKKIFIANAMGELCDMFRASDEKTVLFYWIYGIAFTFQIYFDFSGYSDMAIGLGRVFGFKFPENFNYPYISRSVTEFWRRWHITLSGWFRDYVYIPLGGNRVSKAKWLRNILVVWFLTGLWHGASWNFVMWGLMYGVLLMIEKLWLGAYLREGPRVLQHVYVLFFTVIGFTIFNADGLSGALSDLGGMFGFGGIPLSGPITLYYLRSYGVILALAMLGSTPLVKKAALKLTSGSSMQKVMIAAEPVILAALMLGITAYLVDGSFNPFLYFRF